MRWSQGDRGGSCRIGDRSVLLSSRSEDIQAAAAIGDDRLQQMSAGRVMPDRFTHGSSRQRVEWFTRGMETGDPRACDTFAGLAH
jgi:predicted metalloprotease